jgi:hypothetical protein
MRATLADRLRSPSVRTIAFATLAAGFAVAAIFAAPPRGAVAHLYGAPAQHGPLLLRRIVPILDPRLIVREASAPRESFSARWTTAWHVARDGQYTIEAAADDRVRVRVDGTDLITPPAEDGLQHSTGAAHLGAGPHFVEVDYEQADGGMFLEIDVSENNGPSHTLDAERLTAAESPADLHASMWPARVLWLIAACALGGAVLSTWNAPWTRRGLWPLAFAAIVLFGAALRLDALLGRAGPLERPAWLSAADRELHLPLTRLTPVEFQWIRGRRMYQLGDPAAYLFFAREMKSFYAAHPREPLFIGATKAVLPLVGYQDVAVGLTSALSSLLLVAATFLLGTMVASRFVGLTAALAVAIERDVISWSVEGWRDDMFALFFVLFACTAIAVRRRTTWHTSVAVAVVIACALLTRVTSLSFIAIAALAILIRCGRSKGADSSASAWRDAWPRFAVAFAIAAVLAGPYFINCYRAYGNPLYAINVHTGFYRDREGLPSRQPLSARAYIGSRFAANPVRLTGTFVSGMTTYPFLNKWQGFDDWVAHAGAIAAVLAYIGLVLLASNETGRFLLLITAGSLLPYAFTHDIQGGAEWRFTLHAYPVFLVAAALAVERIAKALWVARGSTRNAIDTLQVRRSAVAAGVTIAVAGVVFPLIWPYAALAEDLWFNRPYTIFASADHRLLFDNEWSAPATLGNVTARWSNGPAASLSIPIARRRTHLLRLRADPADTDVNAAARQSLRVYVNRQLVATLPMQLTEGRVGAYDATVPDSVVHRGFNRVDLLITREGDGEHGDPSPSRIRLWYVRVTPM